MATPKRYEETVAEQLRLGRVGGGQGSSARRMAGTSSAAAESIGRSNRAESKQGPQHGQNQQTEKKAYDSNKANQAQTPSSGWLAENEASAGLVFDPTVSDLQTSWSTYADVIYCVNTYPNGITLSVHTPQVAQGGSNAQSAQDASAGNATSVGHDRMMTKEERTIELGSSKFLPQQFHLRFRDTRDYQLPVGKYFLHRENYAAALETHFSQLHKEGKLSSAVVYFGTSTDPFLSLHKKFDVTMSCIDLLQRYVPGMVVFQTRSPMVISVLPALKALGERAVVAMPVESISEKAIARYTPGKPRIGERLVAAEGLRRQGVRVNLMASPMLPYGDPKRDAWDFAEMLDRHADYVTFGCLASGSEADEKQLKNIPIALKLAADQQFFWLRPHCYQHVYQAMKAIAPQKLVLPVKKPIPPSQLNLFAA